MLVVLGSLLKKCKLFLCNLEQTCRVCFSGLDSLAGFSFSVESEGGFLEHFLKVCDTSIPLLNSFGFLTLGDLHTVTAQGIVNKLTHIFSLEMVTGSLRD